MIRATLAHRSPRRWAGSPCGPKPAVAEAHIDLGANWCGCELTEVRVDWGANSCVLGVG